MSTQVDTAATQSHVQGHNDSFVTLAQIENGQNVRTRVLISNKELLARRNSNEKYMTLTVMDRTGQMIAKLWENAEQWNERIAPGDVVEMAAQAKMYNKQLELTVNSMKKVAVSDPSEFLPTTKEDRGKLYTRIIKWIDDMNHPGLQRLLRYVFQEDDNLSQAFTEAIGATKMHHAYIGGLLEHTYRVTLICAGMAKMYPFVDYDLLVAGALLHDIGKLRTYQWKAAFERTLEGEMLEHIHLGIEMVTTILREQQIVLDEDTRLKLLNMIASHHGRPEWGSAQAPRCAEAFILHQADMIDFTMNCIEAAFEDVQDGWTTQKVPILDRNVTLFVGNA